MSNNNSDSDDKGAIGCVIIALLIFGGSVLIQILETLIVVAVVGGIGFGLYRLYTYDQRTGNLTRWAEDTFGIGGGSEKNKLLSSGADEPLALPQEQPNENSQLLEELQAMRREMEALRVENHSLKDHATNAAEEAVRKYEERKVWDDKKSVLDSIYGEPGPEPPATTNTYARSDEYEKQQLQKQREQKEQELTIREVRVEVGERLNAQDQKIGNVEGEMKDGFRAVDQRFGEVDARMLQMQYDFQHGLLKVMETVQSLKSYVDERFTKMEVYVEQQLSGVREMVVGLRAELKQDIANTRLQFGQEILRIDKQQTMIVGKLAEYEAKMKGFTADMRQMKQDAARFAWEGQKVLERAHTLYQRHKVEVDRMGGQLDLGLKQIAVEKGDFANRVGRAKLMMDEISNEQYLTLKNIGHEKLGVEMLRQDYSTRQENEQMKLNGIRQDIQHTQALINERLSRGEQVAGLNHQLSMSREREAHTSQRLGIMREEFSLVQRLNR